MAKATVVDRTGQPQAASYGSARHPLAAWSLSLVLHAMLLLAAVVTVRQRTQGTTTAPDRDVGIALVKLDDHERRYFDEGGPLANSPTPSEDLLSFLPTQQELAVDASGLLSKPTGPGTVVADEGVPRSAELAAPGKDEFGQSGSTITEIFGVQGEGVRFVYVFDRSGSMGGYGGLPLRAAKHQLLASLKDLQRHHQFQIIFYEFDIELFNPLGGQAQLVWADEATKNLAAAFVARVQPDGGTNHLQPLMTALNMRPDVIFFLTDADEPALSGAELLAVQRRNKGATIHAIQFGVGPQRSTGNFLSRLAAENGGQYRYLNITKLPNEK